MFVRRPIIVMAKQHPERLIENMQFQCLLFWQVVQAD